jgi:sulfur relay (sulfurtransferase) DsrF/TusC family protein
MAEPAMKSLAIILIKPPDGCINAVEAVRHALGGVGEELEVSFLLVDSGVLAAVKGQDAGETGFISLEASVSDCIDMDVKVYVDKASLREEDLEEADLVGGIKVINSSEASEIVGQADRVVIY